MPNEVKQLEGGKLEVSLETGEKFTGDPLEVANKMAEAHVSTKRWGQDFKSKYEEAKQAITAPPAPSPAADPNETQLQNYLVEQWAKGLGYKDATEAKTVLGRVVSTTDEMQNQAVAANFLQQCPDFPNTPEAIDALSHKIDELKWDFTPQSMIAAHTLCARDNKYKPLTAEEQNMQWQAGLQNANRQPPPAPMLQGSSPDNRTPATNEWTEPLDQMRTRLLTAQRAGQQ